MINDKIRAPANESEWIDSKSQTYAKSVLQPISVPTVSESDQYELSSPLNRDIVSTSDDNKQLDGNKKENIFTSTSSSFNTNIADPRYSSINYFGRSYYPSMPVVISEDYATSSVGVFNDDSPTYDSLNNFINNSDSLNLNINNAGFESGIVSYLNDNNIGTNEHRSLTQIEPMTPFDKELRLVSNSIFSRVNMYSLDRSIEYTTAEIYKTISQPVNSATRFFESELASVNNMNESIKLIYDTSCFVIPELVKSEIRSDSRQFDLVKEYGENYISNFVSIYNNVGFFASIIVPEIANLEINHDKYLLESMKDITMDNIENTETALKGAEVFAKANKSAKVFNLFHLVPQTEPYFEKIIYAEAVISLYSIWEAYSKDEFEKIPKIVFNLSSAYGVFAVDGLPVVAVLLVSEVPDALQFTYNETYSLIKSMQDTHIKNDNVGSRPSSRFMGLGY